jgi:predicted nucleic acid-binding protein
MPEIVINTGPIIALVAATGSLEWLSRLYTRVWIPQEVQAEIAAGGPGVPELEALHHAGDAIRIQQGIWISDGLIRQALAAVDESADDFLSS